MGNCRLNAWFAKLKLKALTKSVTNHKISEIPAHDKQPQPTSSTTTSSFASSSSASSSSSSSCGAVPAMSSNKTGQLPYFSHQRKSYYITRDLSTLPPPPPTATLYLYDDNASTSTTRCPKNSQLSQPPSPRETSLSKKKSVAVGRRSRSSIIKSHHKPSPRFVSTGVLSGCKASATIESLWTKPPDLSRQVYPPNSAAETSSDDESMLPEICSSLSLSPETLDDSVLSWSSVSSCRCRVGKKDALINAENNARPPLTSKLNDKPPPKQQLDGFAGSASEFRLPQIRTNITKKSCSTGQEFIKDRANNMEEASEQRGVGVGVMVKGEDMLSTNSYNVVSLSSGKVGERRTSPGATRRFSSVNNSAGGGGGVKLRTNSPRIAANRRTLNQGGKRLRSSSRGRRSMSESLAVVKSSKDPQRDFRASMAEMIVENQICGAKELEDLLACYLCLNSNEYHELIIGVFKQIWFDLVEHCN